MPDQFRIITDASNTSDGSPRTWINRSAANDNPNAIISVTHVINPPRGVGRPLLPDRYHNHPVGVEYRGRNWYIVNLDGAPMPRGLAFNVHIVDAPTPIAYSHRVTARNTIGNSSWFSPESQDWLWFLTPRRGRTRGRAAPFVELAQPEWPGDFGLETIGAIEHDILEIVPNPLAVGVWFAAGPNPWWRIFNASYVDALAEDTEYNVFAFPPENADPYNAMCVVTDGTVPSTAFTLGADRGAVIDDFVFVSLNISFNRAPPERVQGRPTQRAVFHNHVVGLYRDVEMQKLRIVNEDESEMPAGVGFNVRLE